ncbi:MAG: methyl-accepting chemotaxis protein [Desulfobacterales bacterium]|nr:methyl-accepting chemotaxis protein [Desulfobacterales bacterium]
MKKRSLIFKISMFVLITTATLMSGVGYKFIHSEKIIFKKVSQINVTYITMLLNERETDEFKTLDDNVRFQTKTLGNIAGQFIFNFDSEGFMPILTSFQEIQEIMAIQVKYSEGGTFVATWKTENDKTESGEKLPSAFPTDSFTALESDATFEGKSFGKVIVHYTNAHIRVKVGKIRERMRTDIYNIAVSMQKMVSGSVTDAVLLLIVIAIVIGIATLFLSRTFMKPIKQSIDGLTHGAEDVLRVSGQVGKSSRRVADAATRLGATLEEVSLALGEMSDMTRQNADNAKEASALSGDLQSVAEKGTLILDRMQKVIEQIKISSDQTTKIIKTIDEIAFQTDILALNAAVEAARAGEVGVSFAVVADEVRNLAMRSASAARDTAMLIEESQKNAESGVAVAAEVGNILKEIAAGVEKVTELVRTVSDASEEQTRDIDEINQSVGQMDMVAHVNSDSARESVSISEDLSAQAGEISDMVNILTGVVGSGSVKA